MQTASHFAGGHLMKRVILTVAMLTLPAVVSAQTTFDQVSGVFRAAVTLSDLPGGGSRIVLKVQNTQGPGETEAIVQDQFFISGLFVDSQDFFDEYPGRGTLNGGATFVGSGAVGGVWSSSRGGYISGAIGFYDERGWSVAVAGCTQLAGVTLPSGEVVYADFYYGYVQTCGSDAYLEYTIDVSHVIGTPTFTAYPLSYPALVTPEPASVALLGTGLIGIGGVAARRRRVSPV